MVLRPRFGIREESNLLLGLGCVEHGLWDVFQHEGRGWARSAPTNAPFYAVADFVIGPAILTGVAV